MFRLRLRSRIVEALRGHFERSPFPFPHVELYFWRPDDGRLNFGDYLSQVVVDAAAASNGLRLCQEAPRHQRMVAVGSILHLTKPGDVVWGSGINGRKGQELPGSNALDVRAVRGPYTREVLMGQGLAVPEVFGDPAILLPTLLKGALRPGKSIEVGFVPNLHDLSLGTDHAGAELINPYMSWNRCIEAIMGAKLIVASSLHGLIMAEAFGIPARYVRLSEGENLFKYRDYYAGSGRGEFTFATSVAEAIEMGGERPAVHDIDRLLGAFPVDLWGLPRT